VIRKPSALSPTTIDRDALALNVKTALEKVRNFLNYWQSQRNRVVAQEALCSKRWGEEYPLAEWSRQIRNADQNGNRPVPYLHGDGTVATVQFLADCLLFLGVALPEGRGAQGGMVQPEQKDGPALRLQVRGEAVILDGKRVDLNLTIEAQEEALRFLQALIEANGNWVSGPDIESGIRWDRVRKKLPSSILSLTETDRRKGNRLRQTAWRK
jgi:hypothetical protein